METDKAKLSKKKVAPEESSRALEGVHRAKYWSRGEGSVGPCSVALGTFAAFDPVAKKAKELPNNFYQSVGRGRAQVEHAKRVMRTSKAKNGASKDCVTLMENGVVKIDNTNADYVWQNRVGSRTNGKLVDPWVFNPQTCNPGV